MKLIELIKDLKNSLISKNNNDLVKKIHPNDEMYLFLTTHPTLKDNPKDEYFKSGARMLQQLRDILIDLGIDIQEINSFLEFACGYGRFTRHLITAIDPNKIVVSDVYKKAVDFQKKYFKVKGFYSTHNPDDLNIPDHYDVIFVASLFSHLPNKTWKKWLEKLFNSLNDGAILIFSTHGPKCMQHQEKMKKNGYVFLKMSESSTLPLNEYGTTYVTREYVNKVVKKISGKLPIKFYEQYLWDYQDVYVVQKSSTHNKIR